MKKTPTTQNIVPIERIEQKIYFIRDCKVMLDSDLAELYDVPTKNLNRVVKRNINRFPDDFMFRLTTEEAKNWRSQSATSNSRFQNGTLKRGQNLKYLPYAFTEHGVTMLSSILKSKQAVQMNIFIVRAFVKLREILTTNKDLAHAIEILARNQSEHGEQIASIRSALNQLINPPLKTKQHIGFNVPDDEDTV